MKASGRVFKYGDNVDTDVIIPARYLNSSDPAELATHCMEDIDPNCIHQKRRPYQANVIFLLMTLPDGGVLFQLERGIACGGGDVHPVDGDAPAVHRPDTGHRIEHGGFSRAVAADDGDEIAGGQVEVEIPQGGLFIDGPFVEGLAKMAQLKHGGRRLSPGHPGDAFSCGRSFSSGTGSGGWPGRWPR